MFTPLTFHAVTNLLLVTGVTLSNGSKKNSLSQCSFTLSGHSYNLLTLARKDGRPRFKTKRQGWHYAYNPCTPFSIHPPSECQEVAVCKWDHYYQSFTNLGLQKDVQYQTFKGNVELVFTIPESQHWITTIILKCDPSRKGTEDGKLSIVNDDSNPVLQLEHNCCCPDACTDVDPTQPTPAPSTSKNTYTIIEVIGGFVGLFLIAGGIIFCRRRQKRRDEENRNGEIRPLIVDPERGYQAVRNQELDNEALDPISEESEPDDDAVDPNSEESDPDDDALGPISEESEPNDEGLDPNNGESEPDDGSSDPPNSEGSDDRGEAPDADDEASDPDGQASHPIEVPNSNADGSVTDRRGESPHIVDFTPQIREEDLSHPVTVESSPEDQCCEEEPSSNPREPVENSL